MKPLVRFVKRFRAPVALVVVIAALVNLYPRSASAQIDPFALSASCRYLDGSVPCSGLPTACRGLVWDPRLGPHEFVIHRVPSNGPSYGLPTLEVPLTLTWPESWTFLGWDLCYGQLDSGDPSVRNSPLRFSFPGCPEMEQPFLRIRLDCATNGRFEVGAYALTDCWGHPEWNYWPTYVDIGHPCLAAPYDPCDPCDYPLSPAARFVPSSLSLTLREDSGIWSDTLEVWGYRGETGCGYPECGGGMGGCFLGLGEPDAEWLDGALMGPVLDGYHRYDYVLRVQTDGLAPGNYEGGLWTPGSCCSPACMYVNLTITPLVDVPSTDGIASGILGPPFPNPMSDGLHYAIRLARSSRVRVTLSDPTGRSVARILDTELPAGETLQTWRPSERFRRDIPNGVYFLRADTEEGMRTRLVVIVR